jgi:hypothetical protein
VPTGIACGKNCVDNRCKMPERNQTTVVLTTAAQAVKEDLAPIFGLKAILSAGLILFSKLSAEDQKKAIAEASGHVLYEDLRDNDVFVARVRDVLAKYGARGEGGQGKASEGKKGTGGSRG